ncbi:MAG: DUF6492 family protein [Rhabdochlamydiaceae bacterium]|nr:DUF6492 family protein [Candidatus Amphrikana amoebophyrae]
MKNIFLILSLILILPFAQSKEIDVIIPAIEKDLATLDKAIEAIKENGVDVRRVIVISENKLSLKADWVKESAFPFSKADIANIMNVHEDYKRIGWYYQQLLKIYAPFVIKDLSDKVLILDADTIFLQKTQFVNEQDQALLNVGLENNEAYHFHAKRLWPAYNKVYPSYSGISNYMVFDRDILTDLIQVVEKQHGEVFWKSFIQKVDPNDYSFAGASEYEIYFNFALIRHPEKVAIRPLKWRSVNTLRTMNLYKEHGYSFITSHAYTRVQ